MQETAVFSAFVVSQPIVAGKIFMQKLKLQTRIACADIEAVI